MFADFFRSGQLARRHKEGSTPKSHYRYQISLPKFLGSEKIDFFQKSQSFSGVIILKSESYRFSDPLLCLRFQWTFQRPIEKIYFLSELTWQNGGLLKIRFWIGLKKAFLVVKSRVFCNKIMQGMEIAKLCFEIPVTIPHTFCFGGSEHLFGSYFYPRK